MLVCRAKTSHYINELKGQKFEIFANKQKLRNKGSKEGVGNIGGITEPEVKHNRTLKLKTQSQFFKSTLKTMFYTKPRFKLFVIPPIRSCYW